MNESEVGAKHLVMIITNELFCNKYGYDRQGKKENFRMRGRNICSSAFPVLSYSCLRKAARAMFIEFLGIKWVVVMLTERTAGTTEIMAQLPMRFLLYNEMKKVILHCCKKDFIHKLT